MSRTRDRSKSWTGSRRFDYSCKNHGQCGWCQSNRTLATQKTRAKIKEELATLKKGGAVLSRHVRGAT